MGLKLSKTNPLVDETFDGQSGDYQVAAENYQRPFGPEWTFGETELTQLKEQLVELGNPPEHTPIFSLKGNLVAGLCVKVYDGDTAHFLVKFNGEWTRHRFRMIGYNSPELRAQDSDEKAAAVAARDYLADRLLHKKVLLYLGDFDKYGRPLCDVYLVEDEGLSVENAFNCHINQEMIEKGYGVPYNP